MKKQIVFEDVKLGSWDEVGYYLSLPNGVKKELNNSSIRIKLIRKNHGGESNIEDLVLTLNAEEVKQVHIGSFPWGSECSFQLDGIKNLETIVSNNYIYLDRLIINYSN